MIAMLQGRVHAEPTAGGGLSARPEQVENCGPRDRRHCGELRKVRREQPCAGRPCAWGEPAGATGAPTAQRQPDLSAVVFLLQWQCRYMFLMQHMQASEGKACVHVVMAMHVFLIQRMQASK